MWRGLYGPSAWGATFLGPGTQVEAKEGTPLGRVVVVRIGSARRPNLLVDVGVYLPRDLDTVTLGRAIRAFER